MRYTYEYDKDSHPLPVEQGEGFKFEFPPWWWYIVHSRTLVRANERVFASGGSDRGWAREGPPFISFRDDVRRAAFNLSLSFCLLHIWPLACREYGSLFRVEFYIEFELLSDAFVRLILVLWDTLEYNERPNIHRQLREFTNTLSEIVLVKTFISFKYTWLEIKSNRNKVKFCERKGKKKTKMLGTWKSVQWLQGWESWLGLLWRSAMFENRSNRKIKI